MTDVNEVTANARDALRDVQGQVTERMDDVRGYAESADSTIRDFAREKPLLAIACAVGVGFIFGRLAARS